MLNGGENHEKNPSSYVYGRGVDSFENATRVGHSFVGWTDEAGNTVTKIEADAQGDKTLHANWKANTYKINYVLNGGENSQQNPDSYIYGRGVSHFEQATKQGYTFMGWTDQKGKKIEAISAQEQGDKILYASWEKVPVASNENEEQKNEEVAKKTGRY